MIWYTLCLFQEKTDEILIKYLLYDILYGKISVREQPCHCKALTSYFYIRWEVVRMKFDFKDLMSFGMFILALLTLIVMMSQ